MFLYIVLAAALAFAASVGFVFIEDAVRFPA
jgi:hypothetical protein